MSYPTIVAYIETAALHLAEEYRSVYHIHWPSNMPYYAGKADGEAFGLQCGMRELHFVLERLYRHVV